MDRFAAQSPLKQGQNKPQTFNFLGFTHICDKTRKGRFTILRKTVRQKWQAKLKKVYGELRRRMHEPVPKQGAYLHSVLSGQKRYYAVPMNNRSTGFPTERRWLEKVWCQTLTGCCPNRVVSNKPRLSVISALANKHKPSNNS